MCVSECSVRSQRITAQDFGSIVTHIVIYSMSTYSKVSIDDIYFTGQGSGRQQRKAAKPKKISCFLCRKLGINFDLHRLQINRSNSRLFFLILKQNICSGCSKEPSQWDGSFEHPKLMLRLKLKKIIQFYMQCYLTIWNNPSVILMLWMT